MKSFKCNIDSDIDDEFILFNLNHNKSKIQECLDVVKEYVKENKLMIVGGMSIDFALKLMGDKLYSEYSIPDYDVISPDNIDHANNIATIICSKGFENVAAVPAVHKTTMRVQVLGYSVFDSTYIPEYIYDKIPYKEFKGFKFIDPVYQKADQYCSLSILWNITGPSFNIINRLSKDIKRKEMLNKYYKFSKNLNIDLENKYNEKNKVIIDLNKTNNNSNKEYDSLLIDKNNFNKSKDKINSININNNYYTAEPNITLHGKSAYCILYENFKQIANKWNIQYDKNNLIDCNFDKIKSKNEDSLYTFEFLGNTIEFISQGKAIKECFKVFEENSINSIRQKTFLKKYSGSHTSMSSYYSYKLNIESKEININISDLTGINVSLNHYIKNNHILFIANYNYLLAYFLFSQYIEEDSYEKKILQEYYTSILYMVEKIQQSETYMNNILNTGEDSMFLYSIHNLNNNYKLDENYNFFIQNYNHLIQNNKNLSSIPPKNYITYPKCEINKIFSKEDRNNSEFYNDSKKEINETNYIEELEKFI